MKYQKELREEFINYADVVIEKRKKFNENIFSNNT